MEPNSTPFDPLLVIEKLRETCTNLEDLPIEPFCLALNEFTKLMRSLGSALSMAFADITSKTGAMMGHLKLYKEQIKGVMSLIQHELKLGVENLSGENNHKLTKDKNLLKYESGARTTLRLMWFMDFLTVMFQELITDPKLSYPKVCKKAYSAALGPHHELVYRMAAQAGFLVAPGRKVFYEHFCGKEKGEKDCFELFQKMIDAMKPVRETLWAYYKKHKLTELP